MSKRPTRIRTQLFALALCRLFMNTTSRMVFPFLPEFARGLGVSIGSLQRSLSIRSLAGFAVPFLIPLSEKFGRKNFLYAGTFIFAIGCFLAWQSQSLIAFAIAILIVALGQAFYDPVMRAHLGDVVPYEQRGKAVAITEFSWAGAFLVGAPLASLLIARFAWNVPFVWLGLLGLLGLLIIWRVIPDTRTTVTTKFSFSKTARAIASNPPLLAATLYVMLLMFGNILVFSSYAAWMEQQFAVDVSGLGLAAMIIGSAELIGEILAGIFSDRFGKRRMVLLTCSALVITNLLLPQTGGSLVLAWIALFALFITFEMAFICVIPIFTELMPEARSVPLAILAFVPPVTRAIGLVLVGSLTLWGGFQLLGIVASVASLGAVLIFYWWVEEGVSAESASH